MNLSLVDWIVMLSVLSGIVVYGVLKTRKVDNVKSYLLGDKDLPWWTIGLSIMATQASAITFLSTPGQAFESGMGFAQFYFGIPVAMVFLCIFVLPIYYKLNVYTAYEYLEGRFDLKTRSLTAFLFLIQRGLAAGITICAPSIILSNIFGWNLNSTIIVIGIVVIFYTVLGGTKAVSVTQKQQMIVILSGMFLAAVLLVFQLPQDVSFGEAVSVAGKLDKLEVINFEFDLSNRYTFWTGMIAGVFLFLSYFGTDQSQVQRYLSGKSLTESRLGLLFNGIIKVPMQFLVLFVGVLVFIFYLYTQPPIHFNNANVSLVEESKYAADFQQLETDYTALFQEKRSAINALSTAIEANDANQVSTYKEQIQAFTAQENMIRSAADSLIVQAGLAANKNVKLKDDDYVFITFVTNYLPKGLVGLLLAVIFSAAMSSVSSELNALATTTVVDIYRRSLKKDGSDLHYLNASKALTIFWGGIAIVFALAFPLSDNLIELVNIVGSVFYGVILGVFLVAFFLKGIKGNAVFWAAIVSELIVIALFVLDYFDISLPLFGQTIQVKIAYLWLNLIGCVLVMLIAAIFSTFMDNRRKDNRQVGMAN